MEATNEIIHVVFAIIEKEDRSLYNKIVVESKCPAAFCLSWVITWFSHTLPNDTDVFSKYCLTLLVNVAFSTHGGCCSLLCERPYCS